MFAGLEHMNMIAFRNQLVSFFNQEFEAYFDYVRIIECKKILETKLNETSNNQDQTTMCNNTYQNFSPQSKVTKFNSMLDSSDP